MRLSTAFALAIIFVGSPAAAAEWRKVAVSSDTMVFIDAGSVRRSGSQVQFWEDARVLRPREYDQIVSLYEADCDDKSYVQLQAVIKNNSQTLGSVGRRLKAYAMPDTIMATAIEAVCDDISMYPEADPLNATSTYVSERKN